ncbi:hypothetical protein [Acinetobacter sp.]|uniref:hypothetical protein n=1 Tax=Acinetobacter sp. TaxID=472 RepID=UPI00282729B1|nr:hypothetical protein [Acinetobacter sp.]MDR0236527.1 hypothetical protein [Acinetobacter sp.]
MMETKPKFISQPIVDFISPFHKYYIQLFTDHNLTKREFKPNNLQDYFIDFLELLAKKSDYFSSSEWYLYSSRENIPIFLEKNNDVLNSFLHKYHKKNDIDYGFSIPMTMDYSIRNLEEVKQYILKYDHYFSDDNFLNYYDNLSFCYVEEYQSIQRHMSIETIEIIMKSMTENCRKHKFNFQFVSLFDNDFSNRQSPNESENYYKDTYQVYPHRLQCVWKCVVKGNFTKRDIPQASKVENFMRGYTLISTLDDHEYFSSYNSEHIYKANLLEIKLNELGVLPYRTIIKT